ncbi:putative porin [bacterium]|nr:putative porin [bacterium]
MKRVVVGLIVLIIFSFSLFADETSSTKEDGETKKTEVPAKKSWTEYVKPSIDFRYRHEIVDENEKDVRQRERIRIRAGVIVTPLNSLHIGFGLVSGNDSPKSGNQTLGEAFSSKPVRINLAYASWDPTFFNAYTIDLRAGKFNNNFVRVGKNTLIWDSDITLEGFAFNNTLKQKLFTAFLNIGFDWVEERKSDPSSYLVGAQLGGSLKAEKWHITLGGSLYYYTSTVGNSVFYDDSKSYGNSTAVDGNGIHTYLYEYQEVEAFIETGVNAGIFSFIFFGDFVANTASDVTERYGYLAGIKIAAKFTKLQSLSFGYDYRSLEKDAVVGGVADTSFNGTGLGGSAHHFALAYTVSVVKFGANYYFAQQSLTERSDYHKIQLDVSIKY